MTLMRAPPTRSPREGGRLCHSEAGPTPAFTPEQRLLVLDVWKRSGLPAGDFCPLVGVAAATLYEWKRRFEEDGPAGLTDQPRGPKPGSRLPEATKRAILRMREAHGDWGCQRADSASG